MNEKKEGWEWLCGENRSETDARAQRAAERHRKKMRLQDGALVVRAPGIPDHITNEDVVFIESGLETSEITEDEKREKLLPVLIADAYQDAESLSIRTAVRKELKKLDRLLEKNAGVDMALKKWKATPDIRMVALHCIHEIRASKDRMEWKNAIEKVLAGWGARGRKPQSDMPVTQRVARLVFRVLGDVPHSALKRAYQFLATDTEYCTLEESNRFPTNLRRHFQHPDSDIDEAADQFATRIRGEFGKMNNSCR